MMTVDLRPGARIFSPRQMSTESKAAVSPITKGGAVNEMATQQTLLAVAAWERFAAGENDIYDMTDVMGGEEPEEPQNPDQAAADAVTEQINSLPAADALTLEDKAAVEAAREAYEALTDAQKQYVDRRDGDSSGRA